jgi:Ran GTPase-activating protein (RanGAP) involved in mRNA processing and transport
LLSGATPRLRELDLSLNIIGNQGAAAIATALPMVPQIERLDLSDNRIGDQGATALAHALLQTPSLGWFSLHTNRIGDKGASALADVLPHAPQLLWLNVHSNAGIGGPALKRLWHQADFICKTTTRPLRLFAPGTDRASFRLEPPSEDEKSSPLGLRARTPSTKGSKRGGKGT